MSAHNALRHHNQKPLVQEESMLRFSKKLASVAVTAALVFSGSALIPVAGTAAQAASVEVTVNHVASMGSLFFAPGPVNDFATAKASNQ